MTGRAVVRGAVWLGAAVGPLLLALAAMLVRCSPPPPPPPTRGTVRVALGPSLDGVWDWRADQRREVEPYVAGELDRTGFDFVLVGEGEADVVVRAADLSATGACGRFSQGLRYVEVDAACALGYEALRKATGHELLHWLTFTRWAWAGHLCTWPRNDPPPPTCHPTVLCAEGACVLSRSLVPAEQLNPGAHFHEVWTPPLAEAALAPQDLELVDRCFAAGRCVP